MKIWSEVEAWPEIHYERCGLNWSAHFADDPKLVGMGRTPAGAIGSLIAEHGPFRVIELPDGVRQPDQVFKMPVWAALMLTVLFASAIAGLVVGQ